MSQVKMEHATPSRQGGFMGDPGVLLVFLLTVVGIGGFIFWAATTVIAQGITTGGQLSIESRRKTVQHLEGGIIEEILVRDRQQVQQGDVLMTLANVEATSRAEQLVNIILARSFELQRIQAQIGGQERFEPAPPAGLQGVSQQAMQQAASIQSRIFYDMQAAVEGSLKVLDTRIERFKTEITGFEAQLQTLEGTIALERSEERRLTNMLNQQLGTAADVSNVQRRLNDALNRRSQLQGQIDTSRANILEAEEEKRQVERQFIADVAIQLSAARDGLLEAREQLEANADVLKRRQILAPISGQVLNLAYTTQGGVIGAGQPILDIVPEGEQLFVEAQVLPNEIDSVWVGMKVNMRFGSLDAVNPPEYEGRVATKDQDITTNPDTGDQFFVARIELPEQAIKELKESGDFIAGLPVEVFFDKEEDRTPLSFIIQPLSEIIRKGLTGE